MTDEPITGCVVDRLRNANSATAVMSTCYTAVTVRLCANQVLAIATIDGYYKPMSMKDQLTHWGLYKIA